MKLGPASAAYFEQAIVQGIMIVSGSPHPSNRPAEYRAVRASFDAGVIASNDIALARSFLTNR
jgi:hypothetical protein